jgi:hypothetical protein
MRIILFLLVALSCYIAADAQVTPKNSVNAEMQQQILEMKKDISSLEKEIIAMEKTDPAEAASMKKELAALKNMLAMLENIGKPPSPVKKTAPVKPAVLQNSASPIEPLVIKQPITVPTAAQATDRLLWYKGKKINDSTLVTPRGMVVQYNKHNKQQNKVKVQPPKKSDPFSKMVDELTRTEAKKEALVNSFDKLKNGFTYYPELKQTLAIYDDLYDRYFDLLRNTIELPVVPEAGNQDPVSQPAGKKGPSYQANPEEADAADPDPYTEAQLQLARKLFSELPPESSFPPPPQQPLGLCMTCDSTLISKQKEKDSIWRDQYDGTESKILKILQGVERRKNILGVEGPMSDTALYFSIFRRMVAKNKLLNSKYGKDLPRVPIVTQTILGFERQRQLLGMVEEGEAYVVGELAESLTLYEKYLLEQMEAKNHDFVLNVSGYLGNERQKQLLGGGSENDPGLDEVLTRFMKYNRFELILESEFVIEDRTEDGKNELEFKATGAMGTKEKVYGMFIMDKCRYKLVPHNIDYSDVIRENMIIPMQVKSGVKTIKDDEGKLESFNYSGPESYALTFPLIKIDFCNANNDTAWFYTFQVLDASAASTADLLYKTRKAYKTDFLLMANFIFVTSELKDNEDEYLKVSQDVFKTIGAAQNADDGGSTLEKLRLQYEGKKAMDDQSTNLQGLVNDEKSMVIFTANNKQTVLADKYIDTKRKLEEDRLDLKRGLLHFKILHSPLQ